MGTGDPQAESPELNRARLAWLMLQSMLRPGRSCPPMPHDPEPRLWPGARRRRGGRRRATGGMVERLKRSYRVEDIARRLTPLRGAGQTLTGKCPLHRERNGRAFAVWPASQRWRCFGRCATGGDVIDLVRECKARGLEWR